MGIFDFLFGKQIKIENEFFGSMLFLGDKKEPAKSYFECRRDFNPSGKIIEIGIHGDISGPTEKQVMFFRSIEDSYPSIVKSITPLIEDEFGNWKEGFKIQDFLKEFEPVYLRLPRCENKPFVWEISFESEHDRNHTFTLTMSDFEAKEILIDG
ncbi:MAG: hypothetical protein DI535_20215 [Citrobacter freundii]|nr:MAG: hypothetical protein DI535_20215 [Citrobacter freundii]